VNPNPEPAYVPPSSLYAFDAEPDAGVEPESRRRSWRRTALASVLAGIAVTLAGVPLGVLWHVVAPIVPVVDAGTNGFVVSDPSPEEYIAADGWFTLLGFGFGVLAAIVAWLVLRRHRGPGLLLGVTLGAFAAAPLAWLAGRMIGLAAYEHWKDTARVGGTYHAPPDLHAKGALLVPAFAAAIVLTLLAGWSNDPDLDQPGAMPGYGAGLRPEPAGAGLPPDVAPAGLPPLSSGLPGGPDPTAAPAPPAPGQAGPPRG
jgi:hypothetical protein